MTKARERGKENMTEKTRQKLLRAIQWKRAYNTGCGANVVYVPRDVCVEIGCWQGATLNQAEKLGATNFRAVDGQIVADWPRHYFGKTDEQT